MADEAYYHCIPNNTGFYSQDDKHVRNQFYYYGENYHKQTLEKTKKEQPRTNNPEILGTRNGMRTNKIPKTNKQTNKFL